MVKGLEPSTGHAEQKPQVRPTRFVSDNPLKIQKNIPLASLTTLKIGGPARFFVRAESEQQVVEAFEYAKKEELELFVLGGGSNILVSDDGFDGMVLQIALRGVSEPPAVAGGLTRPIDEPAVRDIDVQPPARSRQITTPLAEAAATPPKTGGVLNPYLVTAQAGEDGDGFVEYCAMRDLAGIECLSGIPGFVGGTPVQNVGAY